tara:strand:+ start:12053 stop:12190 length:138 start_codon:yes stop_codon:yes gene_type:complete
MFLRGVHSLPARQTETLLRNMQHGTRESNASPRVRHKVKQEPEIK